MQAIFIAKNALVVLPIKLGENNTVYNKEYFASSVMKGKSAVAAILYVKNDFKVKQNIEIYFFGQIPSKVISI